MITELKIYWDEQDPNDTGWAYRETYDEGRIESGPYNTSGHPDRPNLAQMISDLMDEKGLDRSEYVVSIDERLDGGVVTATLRD